MTTGEQTEEQVYLRALEMADLDRTYLWHTTPALYNSLVGTFRYVSRAIEEEWLRKAQAGSPQQINLAICLTGQSLHIGNIYLRDIDWVARHAELHILIGDPAHRSKGYGQAAVQLLVAYAFQDLGLHRIYLFVLADNTPAVKMYAACGFTCEGRLRSHAFKGGIFKDVLVMGLCDEIQH
jgi:diamine N-acetyltransferase